jgi:hypothetical protein
MTPVYRPLVARVLHMVHWHVFRVHGHSCCQFALQIQTSVPGPIPEIARQMIQSLPVPAGVSADVELTFRLCSRSDNIINPNRPVCFSQSEFRSMPSPNRGVHLSGPQMSLIPTPHPGVHLSGPEMWFMSPRNPISTSLDHKCCSCRLQIAAFTSPRHKCCYCQLQIRPFPSSGHKCWPRHLRLTRFGTPGHNFGRCQLGIRPFPFSDQESCYCPLQTRPRLLVPLIPVDVNSKSRCFRTWLCPHQCTPLRSVH